MRMARKSHAKTRTGCATCKARRIKCKEERPECRNCIKHGVTCPGYTEVQKNAARGRKSRRGSSSKLLTENTLQSGTPPESQPEDLVEDGDPSVSEVESSPALSRHALTDLVESSIDPVDSSWPGTWNRQSISVPAHPMNDARQSWTAAWPRQHRLSYDIPAIRTNSMPGPHKAQNLTSFDELLLECFYKAMTLIPSITFCTEYEIWDNIHSTSTKWTSIVQSILSFSSTYMYFITDDPQYSRAAIMYRGAALQALQTDMRSGREGIDAAIAASILLADQAAFEGDWQASILHHRGLANLCIHHSSMSKTSMFAKTRSFDPGKRLVQRRQINVKDIQSTPDGLGCFLSLHNLQRLMSQQLNRPDISNSDFLGSSTPDRKDPTQDIHYASGGLGHLVAIACDVHQAHVELNQEGSPAGHAPILASLVLQYQEESYQWLTDLPQSVVSEAFEGDLTAVVLMAFKFSLDLVLHRCTLLARGTALLPPPAVVMAASYIKHAHETVQRRMMSVDPEAFRVFTDCMNWPLWVLSWANQFTSKEQAQVIARESGITDYAVSPQMSERSVMSFTDYPREALDNWDGLMPI